MTTSYDLPMPGEKFDEKTVIASTWTADDDDNIQATLVLLADTPPFYTVTCVEWQGGSWTVVDSYVHWNLVHAVNGNEHPNTDPDRPHMMTGPRAYGYVDLGGDV
jgi:predicted metal-dependent enzyme (double-stranded beta helix superfamily)